METMFLLYADESQRTQQTQEQLRTAMAGHWAVMEDASARGVLRAASPLQPVATAATVRLADGRLTTTDGPFVETKEALGGYYIIDCTDASEAKKWAERLVGLGAISAVEFRALAAVPGREPSANAATS